MDDQNEEQKDEILEQLEALNVKLEKQATFKHTFYTGIIYGVGFFIGSAILATIALGILGPIFGKIAWVGESYQTGTTILHPEQQK